MAKKNSTDEVLLQHFFKTREVHLFRDISEFSILDTLKDLKLLVKASKRPIKLNICSHGGSVDYGLALYDFIKTSKVPIHTHCSGMAASMGAILLASGTKGFRTTSKNSRVMIHQPSGGYMGKATDIETHAIEITRVKTLLSQLVANDSGQTLSKVAKDMDRDLWMTPQEALKYGLVDKIV